MRAGPLKDDQTVSLASDDEPVACVGNVAFAAAGPFSLEVVHVMPAAQVVEAGTGVFRTTRSTRLFGGAKFTRFFLKRLASRWSCK